jgi:hypothetical protein
MVSAQSKPELESDLMPIARQCSTVIHMDKIYVHC